MSDLGSVIRRLLRRDAILREILAGPLATALGSSLGQLPSAESPPPPSDVTIVETIGRKEDFYPPGVRAHPFQVPIEVGQRIEDLFVRAEPWSITGEGQYGPAQIQTIPLMPGYQPTTEAKAQAFTHPEWYSAAHSPNVLPANPYGLTGYGEYRIGDETVQLLPAVLAVPSDAASSPGVYVYFAPANPTDVAFRGTSEAYPVAQQIVDYGVLQAIYPSLSTELATATYVYYFIAPYEPDEHQIVCEALINAAAAVGLTEALAILKRAKDRLPSDRRKYMNPIERLYESTVELVEKAIAQNGCLEVDDVAQRTGRDPDPIENYIKQRGGRRLINALGTRTYCFGLLASPPPPTPNYPGPLQ